MTLQLTSTIFNIYRTLFRVRAILPVALVLGLAIVALLLPGTVFAGPGSPSPTGCGGC